MPLLNCVLEKRREEEKRQRGKRDNKLKMLRRHLLTVYFKTDICWEHNTAIWINYKGDDFFLIFAHKQSKRQRLL